MSTPESFRKIFSTIFNSKSFTNFRSLYTKYIKVSSGVGFTLGIGGSMAYLSDLKNKNEDNKRRMMEIRGIREINDQELQSYYKISNFDKYCVFLYGSIIGTTLGVMWPVVVTLGPLYFVFGNHLGSIVSSILVISASIDKNDFNEKEI